MNEHTFLVAVTVTSDTREAAQRALADAMPRAGWYGGDSIDTGRRRLESWWIAEDDAVDGNDCDSAIFVPRGAQDAMRDVIRGYFDHHEQEWIEEGYPFADTDVSGAWFPSGVIAQSTCRHCQRFIVSKDGEKWIDPNALGDDAIWRETCENHDTFTAEHEPMEGAPNE